ncbi:Hypothetical protein I595_420 [Croceitalea dokdonensis DOKDO 023]|uniref:Uncharacterized protein n=1 Tax=Croceitalea dokdonensis DOKDO 023 TaxID=1300341 RepID=A0A0P7AXJ5_9FLAO|nr:hypothetical protein [Croceitalea dokdonensis]KPM33517.1 Hypothetical protein I595_420 [Croceitalea dokdonensis DOKDO 023]
METLGNNNSKAMLERTRNAMLALGYHYVGYRIRAKKSFLMIQRTLTSHYL